MRFRAKLLDLSCITRLSSEQSDPLLSYVPVISSKTRIPYILPQLLSLSGFPLFLSSYLLSSVFFYLYHTDIVSSLAKNIKTCVLKLSADKVCFVLGAQGSLGMNIWCELAQVPVFMI